MKSIYLFILCIAGIIVDKSVCAQEAIRDAWTGKDARVRASYGVLPDAMYDDVIQLNGLSSKPILVVNWIPDEISLIVTSYISPKDQKRTVDFGLNKFADSLISSMFDSQKAEIKIITEEDLEKLELSKWGEGSRIKDLTILEHLKKTYGVDYMLIVKGDAYVDFLTRSNRRLYSQGLYKLGKAFYIYSGLAFGVVDLKTGKLVRNSYSRQCSADISGIEYKKNLEDYTTAELQIVKQDLYKRLINNYTQILMLLGIAK